MAALRRHLRVALGQLRRSEHGIALPMALMVTVVGMGLAAVPVVASINSQGGNQHNQGANEALAAAEAGAEVALREQGALHEEEGGAQLCRSDSNVTSGWCPQEPASGPGSVGLATYTYQVLSCYGTGAGSSGCAAVVSSIKCTEAPVEIVSTGTALVGGVEVHRRVEVSGCAGDLPTSFDAVAEELADQLGALEEELEELEEPRAPYVAEKTKLEETRTKLEEQIAKEKAEGKTRFETKTKTETQTVEHEVAPPVFSSGQIVGIDSLTMSNGANVYNGGVGTNGPVVITGNANACSVWMVKGQTKTINNGSDSVPWYCKTGKSIVESEAAKAFPEVQLPANIASQNSDARLTGADPASGYNRGNINWNESKKELSLNYGELKLEGTLPYYFCRLVLGGGGKLLAGSGQTIRIFFENPANCPSLNGAAQLVISNGVDVFPDSGHGPGFYFVGSSTKGLSKIELAGGSSATQLVIYAPRSKINANNGISMSGTIIGQTLEIAGGASINQAGAFTPPTSTEFVPPETVTESYETSESEVAESPLGEAEDELREVLTELQEVTEEIESINGTEIEDKTNEINQVAEELQDWLDQGQSGSGSNTSFKKTSFDECSATPPNRSKPASGC
jgi:Skp family chaperone for outer membrane proteins